MSVYNELLRLTHTRIIQARGLDEQNFHDPVTLEMFDNRLRLLYCLDVQINEERTLLAGTLLHLNSLDILSLMILNRYKWPLSEIMALSLEQKLFVLEGDLRVEKLPAEAQQALPATMSTGGAVFPDFHGAEWAPQNAEKLFAEYQGKN